LLEGLRPTSSIGAMNPRARHGEASRARRLAVLRRAHLSAAEGVWSIRSSAFDHARRWRQCGVGHSAWATMQAAGTQCPPHPIGAKRLAWSRRHIEINRPAGVAVCRPRGVVPLESPIREVILNLNAQRWELDGRRVNCSAPVARSGAARLPLCKGA